MSPELASELASLAKISDSDIDKSDLAEQLDWSKASIGKYYKPIKRPVSLRLDADVVDWFKSFGAGYQSKINEVLRLHVITKSEGKHSKAEANESSTVKRSAQSGAFVIGKAAKEKKTTTDVRKTTRRSQNSSGKNSFRSAQGKAKKRIAGA